MQRLTAYPALRERLDKLQSKVFVLSSDADVTPIEVKESELEIAADVAIERIKKSKFTSKGDKDKVISLYEEYARNTVGALTKTLGSLQMLASHRATAAPAEPLPQVDAPAASPLRLAEGQPLLLLSWQGSGAGGGPRFGVVDATGGRVAAAVTGGDDAELAYDRCSQAVLPWRPPAAGWDAAFVSDARALGDLAEPARRLAEDARRMESESALRAVGERAREIADGAARCQTIAHAAREAGGAVRSCVEAAAPLFSKGDLKQLEAMLENVRAAVERLQPEAMVTAALRSSGASGARRYAAGQPLTVRTAGGWRDADVATVGADGLCHGLTFLEGSGEPPATLTLHPWNHAPRELPHAAYEAMRAWWAPWLGAQHAQIADALTGKRLDALQQCVAISVTGGAAETQVSGLKLEGGSLTGEAAKYPGTYRLVVGKLVDGRPAYQHTSDATCWITFDGNGWTGQPESSLGEKVCFLYLADSAAASPDVSTMTWKATAGGGAAWVEQPQLKCTAWTPPPAPGLKLEGRVDRGGADVGSMVRDSAKGQRRAFAILGSRFWARSTLFRGCIRAVLRVRRGPVPAFVGSLTGEAAIRDAHSLTAWLLAQHSVQLEGAINVTGGAAETQASAIRDAHSLTAWLLAQHGAQLEGGPTEGPLAVLLTAGPASGKTTLLSQVVMIALQDERTELVPILVKVQVLQRRLLEAPDAFAGAWNYMDAFLRLEHEASRPALYRMLRQAMMARRALLLLDGLDEAGAKRADIERHVVEVLAPQGHVLLCTSRPAGVDEARFAAFRRLSLAPLSDEQQERALEQRLGAERAAALLTYVRDVMPRDDTGQKVTSNPLMLSMVASVYELRQGVGMPATVAELYATASDAMLARGGVVTPELKRLLQRIFFEAHVAQRRLIEDRQLDEAALGLEAPEALAKIRASSGLVGETAALQRAMDARAPAVRAACEAHLSEAMCEVLRTVRERVLVDALPLLSLWQSEPLQLQSSHLSFQEYFAAIALCDEGTELSGTPPWQWPAWWANTVKLGAEIPGDRFGRGLLRAAGVTGDTLDLSRKLGGDRPTVLRVLAAVVANSGELRALNLSQNELDAEDARALAPALMKTTAFLTKLDLDDNKIGPEGAIAIVEALKVNAVLTVLWLSDNNIGVDGAKAIAEALKVNAVLTELHLYRNNIGDDGSKAIAEALKVNAVVTTLNLGVNNIGVGGAKAIAEALKVNAVMKNLSVGYNSNIVGEAAQQLAAAALGSLSLEVLSGVPIKELREGKLTELNLISKGLGPTEGIVLAELIKFSAVVTTLSLSGNNIGDEGAIAIAEALKVNEVLTTLNLRNNSIGDEGAKTIADALKSGTAVLTSLDLAGDPYSMDLACDPYSIGFNINIGDEGAKAIAEALKVNAVLTELELFNNSIGDGGAKAIAEALKVNAVLTKLDIRINHNMGDAGKEAVRDAVKDQSGFVLLL